MNQLLGYDLGPTPIRDFFAIAVIILIPSWTVAYVTEKVIYVIPMLAVCTFIVAQLFQQKTKRLDDEYSKKKDEVFDGHHTGDH